MKNIYNDFINMVFAGTLSSSDVFIDKLTEVIEQKQAEGAISVEELQSMIDRWHNGDHSTDITAELCGIKNAIKELTVTLIEVNKSINGNNTKK